MKPRIGITCAFNQEGGWFFLRQGYVQAIIAAGGIPLLLPCLPLARDESNYLEIIDGLLLSGGGDLDPLFFGEAPHPGLGEISPERDYFEISLTRKALRLGLPILGICRGLQVLNVAAGGNIYQDLGSQYPGMIMHQQKAPRDYPVHTIDLAPGSRLESILLPKEEGASGSGLNMELENEVDRPLLRVNTLHHQAVRNVAPGFVVSARASDGVIEAIETRGPHLVLGVQWHPEYLWEKDRRFLGLFQALVKAARRV